MLTLAGCQTAKLQMTVSKGRRGRTAGVRRRVDVPTPTAADNARGARLNDGANVSTWAVPLIVVAVALVLTIDDRHVGRAADERQIIWTAIALTETGQLAQARGRDFNYVRADGEAVSRFGMGMTLAQVPAAWLAPKIERLMGPGSSQPLFLIAPLVLVLVASWFAGQAAVYLGGGSAGRTAAILLCGLASPLSSHAATSFSEPLQAAALSGVFTCALAAQSASPRRATRPALAAGAFAGLAMLAKSVAVLPAASAALPMLVPAQLQNIRSKLASALIGFVPVAAVWLAFELVRFGHPFGSYPGEGFTNPFWDGSWRLLIGVNTGFLLFFPAAAIVLGIFMADVASKRWQTVLTRGGAVAPLLILVVLAASWWAWHGVWGWGPRLLIPAVPPLAACAGAAMSTWAPARRRLFLGVSIAIGSIGLLQHPVPVANYISNLTWPQADRELALSLAGYARREEPDGGYRISPDHVLARMPRASPFVVFPWFLKAASSTESEAARLLERPPWVNQRPDLVPTVVPLPPESVASLTGPPPRGILGRGFWPTAAAVNYAAVYDEGLADQVIRLHQRREGASALHLARKLAAITGRYDALVLESYRILGNRAAAAGYLGGLTGDRRLSPHINVVLALFERDAGNERLARQFLSSVAENFPPRAPLQAAIRESMDRWPADLQSMTAVPVKAAGE